MREIRCVSRTTVYNFVSLPRLPPPCCRLPGIFQSLLFCVFHSRTNVVSSGLPFFWFVCYPVLVPVPVPVPDERRPGNAFPCASTCMYIEADIELSRQLGSVHVHR